MNESLAEKAARIAGEARKKEHRQRVENRTAMPESAKIYDEFSRVFGKPKSGRMWENGRTTEWGNRWWDK